MFGKKKTLPNGKVKYTGIVAHVTDKKLSGPEFIEVEKEFNKVGLEFKTMKEQEIVVLEE